MSASDRATPVLPADFYDRPVLTVAQDLVGCVLVHGDVSGRIVETEAYHDTEAACHAHIGRTERTRTLFGEPGTAYVYLSYGIHALLNAVCEDTSTGAAVLVRALEPLDGLELARARRGPVAERDLLNGPGKLTQALGVGLDLNGTSLVDGPVRIHARPPGEPAPTLVAGPRIGITKAADLPWRFCATGSAHVSRPWPPDLGVARRRGR